MSVLQCNRTGCENIMCDRIILDHSAYICNDCYNELLEYKETWGETKLEAVKVRERIVNFMDTIPGTYRVLEKVDVDKEFDRLTNSSREE